MKRGGFHHEERASAKSVSAGPLFDRAAMESYPMKPADAARAAGDLGMSRAVEHAERVEPGWKQTALAAVRDYAASHAEFLTEDVRATCPTPAAADTRAWGAVMQAARRAGLIETHGYGLANCSNRSPRVRWKSLIVNQNRTGVANG